MCWSRIFLLIFLLAGCSSNRITQSWRSPNFDSLESKKVLIIGVTSDIESRSSFEQLLKNELNARHINALQSSIVFKDFFQDSKTTDEEIQNQINTLLKSGYEIVLVSLVKGVDNNKSYSGASSRLDYKLRQTIGYYLAYQEASFNNKHYSNYRVYDIETSIFNLETNSVKSLIWSGNYDIIESKNAKKAIQNFVKTLIKTLEKEHLIPSKY